MAEPASELAEAKEPAEPEPVPPQFTVERKIEGTKEQPIISCGRAEPHRFIGRQTGPANYRLHN